MNLSYEHVLTMQLYKMLSLFSPSFCTDKLETEIRLHLKEQSLGAV